MTIQETIQNHIAQVIQQSFDIDITVEAAEIGYSPEIHMGDFAYPCFSLAKQLKVSPHECAQRIVATITPDDIIAECKHIGPYVNIMVHTGYLHNSVIEEVQNGYDSDTSGERILLEYSSPNPAKTFHIGHFRNTILGVSLLALLERQGKEVVAINYLNDTGAHIAKTMWLYEKKYKGEEPDTDRGIWLGNVYVEANALLAQNEDALAEVSEIHQKLEAKDEYYTELLAQFKAWSEADFKAIYKQLGARFDHYLYDSDYIDSGKVVVQELVEKGIAKESDGAIIVDLEEYGLSVAVILKSDGTALYITKDLSMAQDRFDTFNVDQLLYVVGAEQTLHFKQLFKILELNGNKRAADCKHVGYELVRLPEGKIASRKGNAPLYTDLYQNAYEVVYSETKERHANWGDDEVQTVSEKIALAGLKFDMLKYDTNKSVVMDLRKSLDVNGDTGPYILYTVARIYSLLSKSADDLGGMQYGELLVEDEERDIILHVSKYPEITKQAALVYKPSLVAHYVLELAHKVNTFYHKHSVLDAGDDVRIARLHLLKAAQSVLIDGLDILGIDTVEQM